MKINVKLLEFDKVNASGDMFVSGVQFSTYKPFAVTIGEDVENSNGEIIGTVESAEITDIGNMEVNVKVNSEYRYMISQIPRITVTFNSAKSEEE
jgi:hypothetical protein